MTDILRNARVIGIMGMAKNTGKTTTMNYLAKVFTDQKLALTSIGLDGEAIDQVTNLPKPRIRVKENMIVATATACLSGVDFTYDVIETLPGMSALGPIVIVKVMSEGYVVLAGPVTNKELNDLVIRLVDHGAKKILIDGAFDRKTFAGIEALDGIVLATGAALSADMEDVVSKTRRIADLYRFPKTSVSPPPTTGSFTFWTQGVIHDFPDKPPQLVRERLADFVSSLDAISIKGAITNPLAKALVDTKIEHYDLIIDDPSKWVAYSVYLKYFAALGIRIYVKREIRLLMVTINPYSPRGKSFDPEWFLERMRQDTGLPVINVQMEDTYEQT